MSSIPQNPELLKDWVALLEASQANFKQRRTYERVIALIWAEIMRFGRHTITQL